MIKKIPIDFYYENNHKEKIHDDSPIPEYVAAMDGFFGYDSFKRYNPKILDRDHIIYSSGSLFMIFRYQLHNLQSFHKIRTEILQFVKGWNWLHCCKSEQTIYCCGLNGHFTQCLYL